LSSFIRGSIFFPRVISTGYYPRKENRTSVKIISKSDEPSFERGLMCEHMAEEADTKYREKSLHFLIDS